MRFFRSEVPITAINLNVSFKTQQEMLLGILKYAQQRSPWAMHVFTGRDDERPFSSKEKFAGYIGEHIISKPTGIPAIYVKDTPRYPPNTIGLIQCDNISLAEAAAAHFLDRGYTTFAYVGSAVPTPWSDERQRAFQHRLRQTGHTCAIYRVPKGKAARNAAREQKHLGDWLTTLPAKTAVFVANDVRGRVVLDECRKRNIQIPGRLSVLSCDNDEVVCETTVPSLSSLRTSAEEAGFRSAKLLDSFLHGDNRRQQRPTAIKYGFSELVERQSTADLRESDPLVERALSFIRLNAQKKLTVQDIVTQLNVSRRCLEMRFQSCLGTSPHEEIVSAKLQRAKALLTQSKSSTEEIADMCAFANASHFCQQFKRRFSISPAEYRRMHKAT